MKHALNPHNLAEYVWNDGLLQIVDSLPNPVFIKNRDGVYLFVNEQLELFWGKTREQLLGKTDKDILLPLEAKDCENSDYKAWANGGEVSISYETQYCRMSRKVERYVAVNKRAINSKIGDLLMGIVTVVEV